MSYVEKLSQVIYYVLMIYAIFSLADMFIGLGGYDSTDRGRSRSGLKPFADAATGCEYLGTSLGGITPRLDFDGKHVGCVKRGSVAPL